MKSHSFSRLLIVEDELDTLDFLEDVFKNEYIVETSTNGEEAKSTLMDFIPDIIIADIRMPKLNGFELTKWIRKQNSLKNVKVILLSALIKPQDKLDGYAAGADDYFMKPFDTEELRTKIRILLKLKKTEDQLESLIENLEIQVKKKTAQLIKSEPFALIGRNIAGFVHNMNNPLGSIKGISDILNKKYNDEPLLETLAHSTTQLQEIIYSILRNANSKQEKDSNLISINQILKDAVKMQKCTKFGQDITFIEEYEMIKHFYCLPSDLSQVFSNIMSNATQSMYKTIEKILTIKTYHLDQSIVIEFIDTGCGMNKRVQNKIFDPFFTTKTTDPQNSSEPIGTGLGMPTCKTMLESYNGKITVDSKLNKGTIIRLFLPTQD